MTTSNSLDRRQFGLGLAGLAGLALHTPSWAQQAAEKIVVAESQGFSWAVPYLATSKNYWKNHGIEATTLQFTSGRLAFDAAVAGKAQFATSTDSVVGLAGANGVPAVIVAEFSRLSSGMVVAARTDRGIQGGAQLKGKRVATTIGTSGHYFLSRFLSLHGLTLKDVTLVNLRGPDAVTAVTKGDIDAFAWGWDAGQKAIADSGGKVKVLDDTGPGKSLPEPLRAHRQRVAGAEQAQAGRGGRAQPAGRREVLPRANGRRHRAGGRAHQGHGGDHQGRAGHRVRSACGWTTACSTTWCSTRNGRSRPAWPQPTKDDLRALYRKLIYTDALKAAAPDRVTLS
jgi:hypothetical protein